MDTFEEYTGDPAAAQRMRQALVVLAGRYAGTPIGDQISEALAGRTSMKELADDPEFATLALQGAREYLDAWRALTPEQRAELSEQARSLEEQERR